MEFDEAEAVGGEEGGRRCGLGSCLGVCIAEIGR